jgi:hypothetical protein
MCIRVGTGFIRLILQFWTHDAILVEGYLSKLCPNKFTYKITQVRTHPRTHTQTNPVTLIPQTNSTDWATVTCQRNLVPTFVDRGGVACSARRIPTAVNLSFLDQNAHTHTYIRICQYERTKRQVLHLHGHHSVQSTSVTRENSRANGPQMNDTSNGMPYDWQDICHLQLEIKNGVLWDVTSCGSCKNRRFGGT